MLINPLLLITVAVSFFVLGLGIGLISESREKYEHHRGDYKHATDALSTVEDMKNYVEAHGLDEWKGTTKKVYKNVAELVERGKYGEAREMADYLVRSIKRDEPAARKLLELDNKSSPEEALASME